MPGRSSFPPRGARLAFVACVAMVALGSAQAQIKTSAVLAPPASLDAGGLARQADARG